MSFRRQFLRKIWPIQLAFRFLISCRIFLSSFTLSNTSSFLTRSVQLIFYILLQHHISKIGWYFWSSFWNVQISAPHNVMLQMQHFTFFSLEFKPNLLVKKAFFLLNSAFAMTILYLILHVHLASFVILLPKYFKYSTFSSWFWPTIISNAHFSLEILITSVFHIDPHATASSNIS